VLLFSGINYNFNRKLKDFSIFNYFFKKKKAEMVLPISFFFHFSPKNEEINGIRRVNYTQTT
jgi:hypothetical protein